MICFLSILIGVATSFRNLPSVDIHLDGPVRQRWQGAARTILNEFGYEKSFGAVFAFQNQFLFSKIPDAAYKRIAAAIRKNFPIYAEELEGILDIINRPEITFEYLAAWGYFHELGHVQWTDEDEKQRITECTGVILSTNQYVIHGRNMDQSPDEARNLVLHLNVYIGGKLVAQSVDWYWFKVGFVTLLKYNVASLEENWRFGNAISQEELLTRIEAGVPSLAWAYRNILEDQNLDTFEKVVKYLETNQVACSLYNVVAGSKKNEGVIISRDPIDDNLKTYRLGVDSKGDSNYQYLVVTNHDIWEADPPEDPRRTIAENLLANMGTDLQNELGVYAVMDTYPVHNEGTFYTTITITAQNKLIGFGQPGIQFSGAAQSIFQRKQRIQ